jgi:succinate dehydrogenase / fumarate reductase, membrane anchor subunit
MISKLAVFQTNNSATRHWLLQRVTALLLIPLSFKLIAFLDLCLNAPYQETISWLGTGLNFWAIVIWLLTVFHHAASGLQVVIEDYIANQELQAKLIKGINLGFLFLAVVALFFMFRIA